MGWTRRFWMVLIVGLALLGVTAVRGQGNVTVTIFRSVDSVTVYLPADQPFVNLSGFQFQTVTTSGTPIVQSLETLPAFLGLPYATIPTPICFHITRSAAPAAPPLECQTITTLTQTLVDANVFWYDVSSRQERTLTMMLGSLPGICPAGSVRCDLAYPVPTPTPTFPPTPSPLPTATPLVQPTLDVNAAIAATRAAIETATATLWTPTPTATSTPTEDVLATINAALTATEVYNRASTGVTRNEDWTPIIETFEGVEMVLVPAGCFMMGSNDYDDEQPIHEQCFETPFWIDRYEVTQAQFRQFGGVKANENRFDGDQRPVEQITWFEARDYCALRSVRLPTEAEWEYATLGPSNWVYPWGDDFVAENSVFSENSNSQTVNVGSRPGGASWVGALDMSGNVWEWVSSIYRSYPYDAQGGRENIQDANSARVMRGGSWGDLPINLRVPIRNWVTPDFRSGFNGFRCARSYAAGGFNPRRFTPK